MHRNLKPSSPSIRRTAWTAIATAAFVAGQATIAASQQRDRPPGPPLEAVAACSNKAENDACSFTPPGRDVMSGLCVMTPQNGMACAPEGGPPPRS